MKGFAVISILTAVVAAADSVIPGGISNTCQTTLGSLDSNTQLQGCLTGILAATSSLTASTTSSALTSALTSLCSATTTTACPDTLFRSLLTKMYADCKSDFDESSGTVKAIYDSLFNASPFRKSVCTQDSATGKFCVQTLAAASSASSVASNAQAFLAANAASTFAKRDTAVSFPNATTFGTYNLPFQFLTPNSPNEVLCSTCATEIMQAYITAETAQPYGPGIATSGLLVGQTALWNAMSKNCPSSSNIVANAGAAPSGSAPIAAGALNGATNTKVSAGVLGAVALLSAALTAL